MHLEHHLCGEKGVYGILSIVALCKFKRTSLALVVGSNRSPKPKYFGAVF